MNKLTELDMLKIDLIKWSLTLDSEIENQLKNQGYKLLYEKKLYKTLGSARDTS